MTYTEAAQQLASKYVELAGERTPAADIARDVSQTFALAAIALSLDRIANALEGR